MSRTAALLLLVATACHSVVIVDESPEDDPPPPEEPDASAACERAPITIRGDVELLKVETTEECGSLVAGVLQGVVDFGGLVRSAQPSGGSVSSGRDGFVARYDEDGNVLWVSTHGIPDFGGERVSLVTSDGNGGAFFAGLMNIEGPVSVGAIDAKGEVRWTHDTNTLAQGLIRVGDRLRVVLDNDAEVGGIQVLELDSTSGGLLSERHDIVGNASVHHLMPTLDGQVVLLVTHAGAATIGGISLDLELGLAVVSLDQAGVARLQADYDISSLDLMGPTLGAARPDHSFTLALPFTNTLDFGAGAFSVSPFGEDSLSVALAIIDFDVDGKATDTLAFTPGIGYVGAAGVAAGPDGAASVLLYTSGVSLTVGDTIVGDDAAITYALAETDANGIRAELTEATRLFGQADGSRFELFATKTPVASILEWRP